MTVGHLIESTIAKACALMGCRADASIFDAHDFQSFFDELAEKGFSRRGDEVMYDGRTGQQVQADIFIGPTFYYRLKHMSADKINYRATGPVSTTTRQPVRGRSIDGGLRLGEMERDALLANGLCGFLRESFLDKSDAYEMAIDAGGDVRSGIGAGARTDGLRGVKVPYTLKVFMQEAASLGTNVELLTAPLQSAYAMTDEETLIAAEAMYDSDEAN
jgi:DNA-directed RNA polymerase beta subunit